jgi:hypothetical protein
VKFPDLREVTNLSVSPGKGDAAHGTGSEKTKIPLHLTISSLVAFAYSGRVITGEYSPFNSRRHQCPVSRRVAESVKR